MQVQGVFDLVEGMGDGWMVGVVAVCSDGCTLVVVHIWLDAKGGSAVPATVNRVNDWTAFSPAPPSVHSNNRHIYSGGLLR